MNNAWSGYIWHKKLENEPDYLFDMKSFDLLPNDGIILTGRNSNKGEWYPRVYTLDSSQNIVGRASFSGQSALFTHVIVVDSNTAVFSGYIGDDETHHDAQIFVINIDNLTVRHSYQYTCADHGAVYYKVTRLSTGDYIAVGYLFHTTNLAYYYLVTKYTSTLSVVGVWRNSGFEAVFYNIKQMSNGNIVLVGKRFSGTWKLWIMYTNRDGVARGEYISIHNSLSSVSDLYFPDNNGAITFIGYYQNPTSIDSCLLYRQGCGPHGNFSPVDERTCTCNTGYIWDTNDVKCLIPNEVSTVACSKITDCVESNPNRGECDFTHLCKCITDYIWIENRQGCFGLNNKQTECTTVEDCYINDGTADCISNKCDCNDHYLWDDTEKICKGKNDDQSNCANVLTDCVDRTSGHGVCYIGKCACITGYTWAEDRKLCKAINDGNNACVNLDDCIDNDSDRAYCNSVHKCDCMAPYLIYAYVRKKCTIPNDGSFPCNDIDYCTDNNPSRADCDATLSCVCQSDYLWSNAAGRCLAKSDRSIACKDIDDCYDKSGNTKCSTTCNCKAGHGWADNTNRCQPYNDERSFCTTKQDCYDHYDRADCKIGLCTCSTGNAWFALSKACEGRNDGTGKRTNIDECIDSDATKAECNSSGYCVCKPEYLWIEAKLGCVAINDGNAPCNVHTDCVVSSGKGFCDSKKCICLPNYQFKSDRQACLPYNDGTISCKNVNECSDNSYKAECDIFTGKCTCATNYIWVSYRTYCVGKNTGLADCTTDNDCGDYTVSSGGCVEGKCVCNKYHIWKEPTGWCHCNIGTVSPSGKGRIDCTPCEPGKYQDECGKNICKPCPENTYLPTFGGSNIQQCISCPSNSRSDPGASRCTCKDGSYDSGAPGGVGSEYCPKCHPFCATCSNKAYECSKCVSDNKGIYIENNNCFCRIDNGFYYVPGANYLDDKCLPCHPFCKTCHGPTNEDCDSCINGLENLQSFKKCRCDEEYYFDVNDPSNYCKPCHKFCKECSLSATNCTVCYDNPGVKYTGKCECIVPGYFEYYNASNSKFHKEECVQCYPLCKLCDGPYPNQCSSCFKEKGAILSGTSCICPLNYFYDSEQERCAKCNTLCIGCTKNTPDSCIACNTAISFSVQNKPGLCVSDCDSLNGYYRKGTECRECNMDCIHCYGPYSYQCTVCNDPNLVMYLGKCIDTCPEHFINIKGVCYECHESCLNCTDNTNSGCINCQPFLYFYKNQCFKKCPDGTFRKDDYTCEKCQDPCGNCLSLDRCLTCVKKKYWYKIPE